MILIFVILFQPVTATHQEQSVLECCLVTQTPEIVLACQMYEEDNVISVKMDIGILIVEQVSNTGDILRGNQHSLDNLQIW